MRTIRDDERAEYDDQRRQDDYEKRMWRLISDTHAHRTLDPTWAPPTHIQRQIDDFWRWKRGETEGDGYER